MQKNPLKTEVANEVSYDDTTSGIGATEVQTAIEKLAIGKKKNVNSLSLLCTAGYGAYLFTLFTHGIGPDIVQIYVSAGTVYSKSLITGNPPSEISSATYSSDSLNITFAGLTFVSYIGADIYNVF